jgi:pimeloyl-ACP methyl ester carboxylesterase
MSALHVKVYGHGDELVIGLHGWGGDHREFAAAGAHAPPGWRLASFDLPGYGFSPPPPEWTLDGLLPPIEAAIDSISTAPLVLAGYCSGAALAVFLASRRPDRVKRLVLIDPFFSVPWYFRLFTWGAFGERAYRTAFASGRGRRMVNAVLRRRQGSETDFTAAFLDIAPGIALSWMRFFRRLPSIETQRGWSGPVDLVLGERTFAAVRSAVAQSRRLWPGVRVKTVRGAGHLLMNRASREVAGVVFGG